jgi:hypothetical protein
MSEAADQNRRVLKLAHDIDGTVAQAFREVKESRPEAAVAALERALVDIDALRRLLPCKD